MNCICGKTHRVETRCAKAERIEINRALAQEVADAISVLPPHTLGILDLRRGKARARTLPPTGEILHLVIRLQLQGSAPSAETTHGGIVTYGREVGGYVANSYKYPAESDEMHWASYHTRMVVVIARGRAQSRPYGRGEATNRLLGGDLATRAVTEGGQHSTLKLLASMGAAQLSPSLAVRRDEILEEQP